MPRVTVLDGAVGTELLRRGVPTPLPLWSADAIERAPTVLEEIHRDYAAAGATVHVANTFRTDPWTLERVGLGDRWEELTRRSVAVARAAVPESHRVAGSMSPLEDCWRPDLSPDPGRAREAHGRSAVALAEAGADLLLCETFAHPGEALVAAGEALKTGLPVWLSLSQGPGGNLLDRQLLVRTLAQAAGLGVEVVLVNCTPVEGIRSLIGELAHLGLPFGAYANLGSPCEMEGWKNPGEARPAPYAQEVLGWLEAGATVVGGCCGTGPQHVAALAQVAEAF